MMIKHLTAGAMGLLAFASCQDHTPRVPAPVRPAQHIVISENYTGRFNAESGDDLTLLMIPDNGMAQRCDDAGGTLIYNEWTWLYYCTDVDF